MRQKAEQKIREAVMLLGGPNNYRIDKVREKADLHWKVFDKTLLDMARVGTIILAAGDTSYMTEPEINKLVKKGETVYVSFSFAEHPSQKSSEPLKPIFTGPEKFPSIPEYIESADSYAEDVNPVVGEIDLAQWERFEYLCIIREGKTAVQKIQEMIEEYLRQSTLL